MIISYPIAVETSFDDYIKMLFRQSSMNGTYDDRPPSTHLEVVRKLTESSKQALQKCHLDFAYVLNVRALKIIDEYELRKKLLGTEGDEVRKILRETMDFEASIRPRLQDLLEQQNTELRAGEAERLTVVQRQLENENDAAVEQEKLKHDLRRQELLQGRGSSNGVLTVTHVESPTDADEATHRARQERLQQAEQLKIANLQSRLSKTPLRTENTQVQIISSLLPKPAVPKSTQSTLKIEHNDPRLQPLVDTVQRQVENPTRPPVISRKQWKFEAGNPMGRRGLLNLGNTCYMNSVVQCIAQTELGMFVASADFCREILDRGEGGVASALSFLVRELKVPSGVPVNASRLKFELGKLNDSFANTSQQDANELLRTLLDGVHEDLNARKGDKSRLPEIENSRQDDLELAAQYWQQFKQKNQSVVVNLFAFQERVSIVCPSCRHNPRTFLATTGIELPIPADKNQQICVEDCIEAYCRKTTLDSDSLYKCGGCGNQVAATTQTTFHTLPRNLVITLKRFRSYGNFSDKVQTSVAFQERLDMRPFLSPTSSTVGSTYKLIGVINHQGNMHGGHYTADSRNSTDGRWIHFSDDVVRAASEPNFQLAYCLFYLRDE